MSRTTIMADDALLDQLRAIAKEEGVSLGEVIRQALEWRVRRRRRLPSFVGAIATGEPGHDTAARSEEIIAEYIREKYARR
ncbi:MAG TPA: ribbon-helix-helix domain-containing protein [Gaiellaceae bacterium]|nr:ribbon-helix-helix domain-containing protein [Gaiellaceae bacterium]